MDDIVSFLSKLDLFKGVDTCQLEYLRKLGILVSYKKGQMVISTKEPLTDVFIIKEGIIELYIDTSANESEVFPDEISGEVLGEMEIFDEDAIIANCRAKSDLLLIKIPRADFKGFLQQCPMVQERVVSSTIKKWRNLQTRYLENLSKLNEAIDKIHQDEELLYKQQKKLEEESKLKENFIENISHELRTPLTIIQGIIESLDLSNKKNINIDYELFKKLDSSSGYLLDLINELLDFSQLQKGTISLENYWYNISEELKKILETFTYFSSLSKRNVKIIYNLPDPVLVFVDIHRLRQIIYHLVSNAVKFTEKGTVEINISCSAKENDLHTLIVEVKDTGIGIDQEDIPLLFKRFIRLKNKFYSLRGTGLGLALVKTVVDLMNGTITVESIVNEGSEFKISIPVQTRPISENNSFKLNDNQNIDRIQSKIHILLIDDYEDTHTIVKAHLKKYKNISIDSLYNYKDVLKLLRQNQYDIILLDIMLPDFDGYMILKFIHSYYESTDEKLKPKIIAFTALSSEDESKKINESGFDGKLLKPFSKKDLIDLILSKMK